MTGRYAAPAGPVRVAARGVGLLAGVLAAAGVLAGSAVLVVWAGAVMWP